MTLREKTQSSYTERGSLWLASYTHCIVIVGRKNEKWKLQHHHRCAFSPRYGQNEKYNKSINK
jgi:hypothetical protein